MGFETLQPKPKLIEGRRTAVIDLDFVKYSAASVGDRRWIEVVHKATGHSKSYESRTEFWGRLGNGGAFALVNQKRAEKGARPLSIDEFEIVDKVEAKDPIENILHSAKLMVEKAIKESEAEQYIAYYGKGTPDRVARSTLVEYKGKRGAPKPTALEAVTDYLANKFCGICVEGIETDDAVVMECFGKPNYFIIGVDKDYRGSGVNFYDVGNPDEGIIDTTGVGELKRKLSGKVTGRGFLFKMFQVCSEDAIDNYKAHCFSEKRWGAVSAYKALKDCTTPKEVVQASVDIFKELYPEPITVTGWRGDEIEIDWLYVMQEMYDLAHLQRWKGDTIVLTDFFDSLNVSY